MMAGERRKVCRPSPCSATIFLHNSLARWCCHDKCHSLYIHLHCVNVCFSESPPPLFNQHPCAVLHGRCSRNIDFLPPTLPQRVSANALYVHKLNCKSCNIYASSSKRMFMRAFIKPIFLDYRLDIPILGNEISRHILAN
jgi:hypothetical protein